MKPSSGIELKVAAVNMRVASEKEENLTTMIRMIGECHELGVDLLVFPELSLQGYPDLDIPIGSEAAARQHRRYVLEAEAIPGPSVEAIKASLHDSEMIVQFGLAESGEVRGILYNSVAIVSAQGVIGVYRKIHNALEFPYFNEGYETPVFALPTCSVASLICFDLMIPELARVFALKGAEVLLVSTAWPRESWPAMKSFSAGDQERAMSLAAEANAAFNQVWVVVSNQCGRGSSGVEYAGQSQIVKPSGTRAACAGQDEGIALTTIPVRDGVSGRARRRFSHHGRSAPALLRTPHSDLCERRLVLRRNVPSEERRS